MTQIWFKLFFRNAKKNWLNTLINISGLTLGLVGLIIVLLYFNEERSYDQWNPHKNLIYKVGHNMSDGQIYDDTTQPEGPKSAEVIPEIIDYFAMPSWYGNDLLVANNKSVYTDKIVSATANFFKFFPHPILTGNSETFLNTKDKIVISETIKTNLFGNKKALGETIKIGKSIYTVSGIFKRQKPSVIAPSVIITNTNNISLENNWDSFSNNTYYKVEKGTNIKDLEVKLLQVFIDNKFKKDAEKAGIPVDNYIDEQGSEPFLERLNGFRLHSKGDLGPLEGKGNYLFLMIMLGLSILIIIISSINFINLSIASASQRAKEVGVKKILGISVLSMKFQYALEIIVQCVIALIFALIISELILPIFNNYLNSSLELNDWELLIQMFALISVIALFIGSLFALYLSNFKTINVLKGNFSRSGNMIFLRNLMLGLQFVVSGFFLIGGLVVFTQVNYMNSKELGFSGEQILVVEFANNHSKWKHYQLAKNVFANDPNIVAISTSLETPGTDEDFSQDIDYKGLKVDTKFIPVDFGHLEMMQTKMVAGRSFSRLFASDTINSIILNETVIKRLGIKEPINKRVYAFGKEYNIIGVVKDYHTNGFDKKIKPIFYMHFSTMSWLKYNLRTAHFKLKADATEKSITKIERFWNTEIEPGYPFSYYFIDKQFEKTYKKYEQQHTLFTILTFVVIFIALLGLFALATLTVQQRLKEVAIRKTLGASVKEIMLQLIKSFIKIVLFASLILIPLTYYFMQNWLDNFVYRVEMPLLPYIITPIILIILVIVVVGVKAFNATKIDLIKYLKFE